MADESGTSSEELTLESSVVVKRPRRRALWGVLAAVAVAAGALAVTAGGGDDDLPTLPVALGAATAERDSAAGAAPMAADDMRMAWVTYLAGDDLPALGGEGPVYRLTGAVEEDQVRALAETLGIDGELRQEDGYWHLEGDDAVLEVYEGGSWWYSIQQYEVLPADGGGSPGCEPGPAVDCGVVEPLPADAPPTTIAGSSASCTTSEAADGTKVEECVSSDEPCPPDAPCTLPAPVEPAADLPSEDEARTIALDLLRATGAEVDDAKVMVDGPYDAWYVNVEPTIDGLPVSGLFSSVAVGSKGAITNASGNLATPELIGDYPLIDTRAAIDRLNEQQGSWFAYAPNTGAASSEPGTAPLGAPGTASSRPAVAIAEDAAVGGCAEQPDGSEICTDPAPVPCVDPATGAEVDIDTPAVCGGPDVCMGAVPPTGDDVATTIVSDCAYPEPEPVEITLHDAERVLMWMPSSDGSAESYLLSGYRLSGDDGAIVETAAVADDSLAPTTTVPATDTTIPPEEPSVDPSRLEPGQEPELGVGYYVDVNSHCGWFVLGDTWWATDAQTPLPWATPTEGGMFTLTAPDTGTFVGDADATKTAEFTARGPAEELPPCQ